MKITNIRVLNNYKVKLINAKFSGVNPFDSAFKDQGTRTPNTVPTPPTTESETFEQKFNRVFNYLIERYEPGWSASTQDLGKAATMQLLGISAAINPLILGGTVETSFNYTTGNMDDGWFDVLTHPKDFASSVRAAYAKMERARSPKKASNKFIQYNLNGIYAQDFLPNGGNAFFGYHPKFDWYPGNSLPSQIHMGFSANYDNGIRRTILHSPYGNFSSPMNSLAGNWRRYPWLSDRYTAESFQFDMYLLLRENSTIRDMLNVDSGRTDSLGVVVNGITDSYLNTSYKGLCFAAGLISKVPFADYGRTGGGYSADQVLVGSPWIRYPEALTYSTWWGQVNERAGLCFAYDTLVLFNGTTFPNSPQDLRELAFKPPMTDVVGISYGYGNRLLQSLDDLSSAWGNSMEFIAYLGSLPYGTGLEMRIPFGLYKDPTIFGNKKYFKWRLDASVSHWKQKFKSPNDGFAHVIMDASAVIERTFHKWQAPGYTLWTNIANSGASYVENIPVEWARDQYNYTFGDSGPDATGGVVLGVERFAQYMFKDDVGLNDSTRNDQRRFNGDTNPRHWCLDDDKATDLFTSCHDMFLGQRKWGLTYSNSIWGMGICGTSELGEIMAVCTPDDSPDTNKSIMSAYPFFYNVFTEVQNDGDIVWKRVPGTFFNNTSDGVPWINDRRFRLFYMYPTMLALNMSIVDYFHDGIGYYNHLNKSGWYDKSLGPLFNSDMESNNRTTKPPQNFWTGIARTSEFELLYACMKGGITAGLDSLYFNELYTELKNGDISRPDTSRTEYFRALDFAVFGSSYKQFPDIENHPSVVPMLRPTNERIYYRGNPWSLSGVCGASLAVNNTGGMPLDQFNENFALAQKIPSSRRVLMPTYWLLDGPVQGRMGDFFWKQTNDGTTYGTDIPGKTYPDPTYPFADTTPPKFNTIWAYENRANAKQSFQSFLKQAKAVGMEFKHLQDDSESGNLFGFGSFYNEEKNLTSITADIDAFATGSFNYLEIPDARRAKALVLDPRFRGVTNSINGRSFAEEFEEIYNDIRQAHGEGICGASAETILNSHLTNVADRFDFKQLYGGPSRDRQYQWYAWNSALYTFWHGDLRSKIIGGGLNDESGFGNVQHGSSDVYSINAEEARFAVDMNGHHRVQQHIPGYGHVFHSYGQLSGGKLKDGSGGGGVINDFGYPPTQPNDDETKYGKLYGWHPTSEGGITFGCSAYQAFVNDIRRARGILRTRPQAYADGMYTWVCASLTGNDGGYSGAVFGTQFYHGNCFAAEYYKEHIFHLCLNGVSRFNSFHVSEGEANNPTLLNECLVEWRTISGNTAAVPCSSTGSTGATLDRIDLYQAGRNCVISGAYTDNEDMRLWRITVPPNRNVLTRTNNSQSQLPERIVIEPNSRGVWIEAPAEYGQPEYESGTIAQNFFFGDQFNSPFGIQQPTWFNKSNFSIAYLDGYRFMKNIYEANIGNTSEVFYETSMFENYPLNPNGSPPNPRSGSASPPYNYQPGPTFVSNLTEFRYRPEYGYFRENGNNESERVIAAFDRYVNNPAKFDVFAKYKPDLLEVDMFEVAEHPLIWKSNVQVMTSSGMTAIGHTVMIDRTPNLKLMETTVNLAHERGIKVLVYFKPIFPNLNYTYYPVAKAITGYPQRYFFNNMLPRSIFNPEFKRVVKEVMQEVVKPQGEGGLGVDAMQWDFNFMSDAQLDFSDYALDIWAKHKGYSGYTDAAYITWAVTNQNFPFPDSGLTAGVLRGLTWMYPFGDLEGTATHDLVNNPNFTETQRNNIYEYYNVLLSAYEDIIEELAKGVEVASHGNALFLPANDSQIHRSDLTQHEDLIRYAQSKKTEHMVEPRGLNRLRPRSSFYTPQEYADITLPGGNQGNNPAVSVLAGTKDAEKIYADINCPDANTIFNIQYKRETLSDFKSGYSWHEQASADTMSELPVGSTGAINDAETFNTLDYLRYPSGGYFFNRSGWGREDCIPGYLRGKYQKNLLVNNIFITTPLSGLGWLGDRSRNDNGTTGDAYYNPINQVPPRSNYGWYRKMMYHHRKYKEIIQDSNLPLEFKKPYSWVGIHCPPRGTILTKLEYMGNFAAQGFRYIKQHLEPDLTNGSASMYTYKTNSMGQNFGQYYHPICGCVEVCESNMIPYSLMQNSHIENEQFTGLGLIIIPHREFITQSLETKLNNFKASGGNVLYMDEIFGGTAAYDTDDPRLKGRFYDLDSRDSEKEKLLSKILEVGGTPPAIGTISKYEYNATTETSKYNNTKAKCSAWYRYSNIDKDDSFVVGVQLLNDMNWMDDRKNGIGGVGANYSFRYNELEPTSIPNKQSSNPKLNGVLDIDLWGYGPNWRLEYNALSGNPDPLSGITWPLGGASGGTASMFYPERESYWGVPIIGGYNGRYWSCILSMKLSENYKIGSAHKFYIDQENEPNDIAYEKKAISQVSTDALGLSADHIAYRYDQPSDSWKIYVNNIGMHADVRFKISPKTS